MITLASAAMKIYVCAQPTDMRKGFDGLCGLAQHVLRKDPLAVLTATDGPRRFIGCDRDEDMITIARSRVSEFSSENEDEGESQIE